MKITIVLAVLCFVFYISETNAALRLGLGTDLELPIIGELNTDANIGVNVQKGLLGLTKNLVKGLMAKATSAIVKRFLPKESKPGKGFPSRLNLKDNLP